MKAEITVAADFLVSLARAKNMASLRHQFLPQVDEVKLQRFKMALSTLLTTRYQLHWFPECPNKGSAYRCIRINGKMDPVIVQAGDAVGLDITSLRSLLPSELTMWIDPQEVSYRIGENGSICVCDFSYGVIPPPRQPPPRQSPDVFLDPRYEDIDPMVDFMV